RDWSSDVCSSDLRVHFLSFRVDDVLRPDHLRALPHVPESVERGEGRVRLSGGVGENPCRGAGEVAEEPTEVVHVPLADGCHDVRVVERHYTAAAVRPAVRNAVRPRVANLAGFDGADTHAGHVTLVLAHAHGSVEHRFLERLEASEVGGLHKLLHRRGDTVVRERITALGPANRGHVWRTAASLSELRLR